MIRIGRMSLHLPAEFADRAGEVAYHIGQALATYPVQADRRIDHISGVELTLPRGASSADAGRAIVLGAVGQGHAVERIHGIDRTGTQANVNSGVRCNQWHPRPRVEPDLGVCLAEPDRLPLGATSRTLMHCDGPSGVAAFR